MLRGEQGSTSNEIHCRPHTLPALAAGQRLCLKAQLEHLGKLAGGCRSAHL